MKFNEALQEAINHWNKEPIENEWYFEEFRDKYVEYMSPEGAFAAINECVSFLVKEKSESTSCEILQTMLNLAKKSQTTELPPGLEKQEALVRRQFSLYGDYSKAKMVELFKYYRK